MSIMSASRNMMCGQDSPPSQEEPMPNRTCPFCQTRAHMEVKWGYVSSSGRAGEAAATCAECGRLSAARFTKNDSKFAGLSDSRRVALAMNESRINWYPETSESPDFPDVPDHISEPAKEAHSSYSIGNLRASILMARAVIEASAKEKGITSGRLVDKIDEMEKQGHTRAHIKEAAHELRHAGNDMAHGDFGAAPDKEDVEDFLTIMDEILNDVFQSPARTERLRAKRQAR